MVRYSYLVETFVKTLLSFHGKIEQKLFSKFSWWPSALKVKLTINKRIRRLASTREDLDSFSNFLIHIGNRTIPQEPGLGDFTIRIFDEFAFQSDKIEDFID